MKAMDVFQRLIGKISSQEIKAQIDIIPIAPETSTKQKYNSSAKCGDFEFEPLTEDEKREFVNSLDANGKGKPIGRRRHKPLPCPSPMDATLATDGSRGGEHLGQISRLLSVTQSG